MMYPLLTFPDETLITHSDLLNDDGNGSKSVAVHFERPKIGGFDTARCILPSYEWVIKEGYSDEEIQSFEQILKDGAHLFFKYAELGGMNIATTV